MTKDQKNKIRALAREMSNAAGFALHNAEAGHEESVGKI